MFPKTNVMRHWKLTTVFLVTIGALSLMGIFSWRPVWPGPRITRERFELIQLGMTEDQVARILGGPPGDYSNDAWSGEGYIRLGMPMSILQKPEDRKEWLGDDLNVYVDFDERRKVLGKGCE